MTRTFLVCLLALVTLGACSKPTEPEQQIRALIQDAETAIEKKEIGTARGYVSDRYADDEGRDRRAIDGLLRLYVLRHENIHLLTRVAEVRFPGKARAQAVVYVAMAAQPIERVEDLTSVRADLYQFELDFAEEHAGWRLTAARWRPALPSDFI